MKIVSWLLSWRYLISSSYEKTISVMTIVAIIAISISAAAVALVTAIMHGFEHVTHEKIRGINAPIIIRGHNSFLDYQAINQVLIHEFPAVLAASPRMSSYAVLTNPDRDNETQPQVITIVGIDPLKEQKVSSLEQKIIHDLPGTTQSLATLIHDNQIIIGNKLAHNIHAGMNNNLTILFSQDFNNAHSHLSFEHTTVVVGGTFKTGIDEYDAHVIFCSIDFLHALLPENGIEQINLALVPQSNEDTTITALHQRFDLPVYSWKDLYPALVAALKLEKYVSFFVLTLVALVACMNSISLLFMQIMHKKADLALLTSLGASFSTLEEIFMIVGMAIISGAAIIGISIAYAMSWLLQSYPFITLPDVYYVTHLPAHMTWQIAISVFVTLLSIGFIAIKFALRTIRAINIADVLRFEG